MKYKAQQIDDTQWAVGYGKRFFPNTVTPCKAKAEELAIIYSMRYYFEQAEAAYRKGVDKGLLDDIGVMEYLC